MSTHSPDSVPSDPANTPSRSDGTDTDVVTHTCEYCSSEYADYEGYDSTYCSKRCAEYAIGADALSVIVRDHRFCSNCFKQIREVEPPGRSSSKAPPDFAIGYAYPTQYTVMGIKDISSRQSDPWLEARPTVTRASRICECGVTHHRMMLRPLSRDDAIEAAKHLSDSVLSVREKMLRGSEADAARAKPWSHDKSFFVGLVDEMQSYPEVQYRDNLVFERALTRAMARATDSPLRP